MPQSGYPMDLEEAIKDLDTCTAALHTEFETVELRKGMKARESSRFSYKNVLFTDEYGYFSLS